MKEIEVQLEKLTYDQQILSEEISRLNACSFSDASKPILKDGYLQVGTIEHIVHSLVINCSSVPPTSESDFVRDPEFAHIFFYTYETFITSQNLFEKLSDLFDAQATRHSGTLSWDCSHQVLFVLWLWMF